MALLEGPTHWLTVSQSSQCSSHAVNQGPGFDRHTNRASSRTNSHDLLHVTVLYFSAAPTLFFALGSRAEFLCFSWTCDVTLAGKSIPPPPWWLSLSDLTLNGTRGSVLGQRSWASPWPHRPWVAVQLLQLLSPAQAGSRMQDSLSGWANPNATHRALLALFPGKHLPKPHASIQGVDRFGNAYGLVCH